MNSIQLTKDTQYIEDIEYIEDLYKELYVYVREQQELINNCKSLTLQNKHIMINYVYNNDNLYFKNVRQSSTANFISVNAKFIQKYNDINMFLYEKNCFASKTPKGWLDTTTKGPSAGIFAQSSSCHSNRTPN